MVKKILQMVTGLAKTALQTAIQGSGMAALYFCASAFLAALLLIPLLVYAWNIDKERAYRALAVLQGVEATEIQQAERELIAEKGADAMLERRAMRNMERDYFEGVTQSVAALPPPPEPPKPEPPPPVPSDAERISAYDQRVKADVARANSAGLGDLTDIIGNADTDWAKEVIRKFWKDGENKRVLQMFAAMEDRERKKILYAMQQDVTDELKDLCEILLRIGDGEPMTSILNNAAREP